jgi:acetyl esterase/lipase
MRYFQLLILCFGVFVTACAQTPERIKDIFPKETVFYSNVFYAGDTLKKHLLDIYLPANAKANVPVVIWVHGGGWRVNDKYADMNYMKNTIRMIIEKGYAIASIDYRHSTTAKFPAQIQDCNQAIQFLYDNASKYKLDKNKFVVMGFSAGGHLGSLLALSHNNNIKDFSIKQPSFKIKAMLNYYGPVELLLFYGAGSPPDIKDDAIATLLGVSPIERPDVVKYASPSTYIDKDDPPFFIVHGEKDESVPVNHSYLLQSYLNLAHVKNEIHVVKGAPHFGEMFDNEDLRKSLSAFLDTYVK